MMSPEARVAASERMKKMRAEQKLKKADPALQEALAKAPFVTETTTRGPVSSATIQPLDQVLAIESPAIRVSIDWQNISIAEGESFYAILKNEFEKAGRILNARRSAEQDGYTCFMCHKHHAGRPGMTDLSYQDPKTGLFPRVDLCGELCVVNYHKLRIDMRTAKHIDEAKALQEA
jgi:hypothetical protein